MATMIPIHKFPSKYGRTFPFFFLAAATLCADQTSACDERVGISGVEATNSFSSGVLSAHRPGPDSFSVLPAEILGGFGSGSWNEPGGG